MISRPVFNGFEDMRGVAVRGTGQMVGSMKISIHNEKYHGVEFVSRFRLVHSLSSSLVRPRQATLRSSCLFLQEVLPIVCFGEPERKEFPISG